MSSEHCAIGSIHTGTPIGTESVVADRKCYVTGSNKTNALLYIPDVYGYEYNNHRLLADTFAKEIDVTVYVGDFLEESGFTHLSDEQRKRSISPNSPNSIQRRNDSLKFSLSLKLLKNNTNECL